MDTPILRTKLTPKMELEKEMKSHIQGINIHMTLSYLDKLTFEQVLRNCHPINRIAFVKRADDLGLLTEKQVKFFKSKAPGFDPAPFKAW